MLNNQRVLYIYKCYYLFSKTGWNMLEPRLQEDELGEDDTIRDLPDFSSADRDGLRVDHVCGVFIVFLVWFEDSIHMATS